jgi:hypothetical protein
MSELLAELSDIIDDGKQYIQAESEIEGLIHIAEGNGFLYAEGTAAKRQYEAKKQRGIAEKENADRLAMAWAVKTRVKKILAEIDVCRSIYSQRKAELNNAGGR